MYASPQLALALFVAAALFVATAAGACFRLSTAKSRDDPYFKAVVQLSRHVRRKLAPALVETAARELREQIAASLESCTDLAAILLTLAKTQPNDFVGQAEVAHAEVVRLVTTKVTVVSRSSGQGLSTLSELGAVYGLLRDELSSPLRQEIELATLRNGIPTVFERACWALIPAALASAFMAVGAVVPAIRPFGSIVLVAGVAALCTGAVFATIGVVAEFRFARITRLWCGRRDPEEM